MSWEKSEVISEFLKIAEEQNLLGLKKSAKAQKNPYQEDLKIIEDKKPKELEKSIIEMAHPKSVYVAESRGDGGLVENQIEQHKKLMEIINKMPTGSLAGLYASTINEMVKLADKCDEIGEIKAADAIVGAANNILSMLDGEESPLE